MLRSVTLHLESPAVPGPHDMTLTAPSMELIHGSRTELGGKPPDPRHNSRLLPELEREE